jgi:biopolymer transport protein ExbD
MAELATSVKAGKGGLRNKQAPRIDLTAMVDLAFLLITFFIMATSLAKPKAIQLAMPVKGPAGPVPASRTMTICLGNNNKVLWYMGMAGNTLTRPQLVGFSKGGLRVALINASKKVLQKSGKPMIVILKPGKNSVYSNFIAALDELNIAGVRSYAVANISAQDIDMLKKQNAF